MKEYLYDSIEEYNKNKKYICYCCEEEVKDLEKGCSNCDGYKEYKIDNFDESFEKMSQQQNKVSNILKLFVTYDIVIGFIISIIIGVVFDSFFTFFCSCLVCLASVLTNYILAEVIQILHDIRYKLWKK